VPISIRNSRNPEHHGTVISSACELEGVVKSIATQLDRGLVCLVGAKISPEAARASKVLATGGVPAELDEASDLSIIFRVPQDQIATAVRALHREFFPTTRLASGQTTTPGLSSPCFAAA